MKLQNPLLARSARIVPFMALIGSCGPARTDALAHVRERGFIRAGIAQEAPYSFTTPEGGVGGEAAEALRHALAPTGVDSVRWILLDFEDLMPALQDGRVDVVAAGLFVTPERSRRVRFSRPTLCVRPALVWRRGEARPSGLEEFGREGGPTLAVVEVAVEQQAAFRLGIPRSRLVTVPDVSTGLAAVTGGRADALAISAPSARQAISASGPLDWESYEPPSSVASLVAGCSALAMGPEEGRLASTLDEGLDAYLGSPQHAEVLDRLELDSVVAVAPVSESPGGGV